MQIQNIISPEVDKELSRLIAKLKLLQKEAAQANKIIEQAIKLNEKLSKMPKC